MGLEQPAAPRDPQQEAIRGAILEMFPGLKHLEKPEDLERVLNMARAGRFDEMDQTNNRYWLNHAQTQAQTATERFAKAAGVTVDKLPKNFTQRMAGLMARYISEDETGARSRRFDGGDPTLIDEFVADAAETWINPFRTQQNVDAARDVERNRRLPQRGPAGAPGPQAGGGSGQKRSREDTRKAAREFVRTNLG